MMAWKVEFVKGKVTVMEEGKSLATEELLQVDLDLIFVSPHQPRRRFCEEELEELAASILELGLIHPPLVRRLEDCGSYELISGERRCRACRLAGLKSIPVIVCRADHPLAAQRALVENIQRVDLGPIEIARALKNLADKFTLSQEELALRIGKQRSTVANYLRLLGLPKAIQASVEEGSVTMGHAKAILALGDESLQHLLHEQIVSERLSVRQAEAAARRIGNKAKKQQLTYSERDFYLEQLEERLQRKLGTRVSIQGQGRKGKVTLHYYNLDDLDRLLEILGVKDREGG